MTSASISRKKFLENHKGGCTDIRKFESCPPSQPVRSFNASHVNVAQNGAEQRGAAATPPPTDFCGALCVNEDAP